MVLIIILFFCGLAWCCWSQHRLARSNVADASQLISATEIEPGELYFYKVDEIVRVIDGDTIEARIDLGFDTYRVEILRLYGIDAPETRGAEKAKGDVSEAWLVRTLSSAEVIEVRTIKDKKGSFGRYLAVIFCDGTNVNAAMVDAGMADLVE